MTEYYLKDGSTVSIIDYDDSHAESIATGLFRGVSKGTVIQQRSDLLSPGPEEVHSVCCISRKQVIGVCTGVRKRWFGERHRIELVQVVVKEEFQGLGVSKSMMKEIADHFAKYGIEIIQISAEASNEDALAAYERMGFVRFGVLKDGLRYPNGQCSDEILLAMKLHSLR